MHSKSLYSPAFSRFAFPSIKLHETILLHTSITKRHYHSCSFASPHSIYLVMHSNCFSLRFSTQQVFSLFTKGRRQNQRNDLFLLLLFEWNIIDSTSCSNGKMMGKLSSSEAVGERKISLVWGRRQSH